MPKYKIALCYTTETTDLPCQIRANFKKLLGKDILIKVSRLDNGKIVIGELPAAEILPLLLPKGHQMVLIEGNKYRVKTGSPRYLTFNENQKCVICGVLGTRMVLEQHTDADSPHFNLYSDDDILLTKDHIVPKAAGGSEQQSNFQTMCVICNNLKASTNISIENLKKIRKVYDESEKKKSLSVKINQLRMEYAIPIPKKPLEEQGIHLTSAMRVVEFGDKLCLMPPKNIPLDVKQLASLGAGTRLFPTNETEKHYVLEFGERQLSVPKHMTKRHK